MYSKTWLRPKHRAAIAQNRRTFAHSARGALRDAYRARKRFVEADSAVDARLAWQLCFTCLRTVGHFLQTKDAARSEFLTQAIEESWRLHKKKANSGNSMLDFIIFERNSVLKDGKTTLLIEGLDQARFPQSARSAVILGGQRLFAGEVIKKSLEWWELELDIIEKRATDLLAIKKRSRRARRFRLPRAHEEAVPKKLRFVTES